MSGVDLEFISTDDLVAELKRRHYCAFVMRQTFEQKASDDYTVELWGEDALVSTTLGLTLMAYQHVMDELKRAKRKRG